MLIEQHSVQVVHIIDRMLVEGNYRVSLTQTSSQRRAVRFDADDQHRSVILEVVVAIELAAHWNILRRDSQPTPLHTPVSHQGYGDGFSGVDRHRQSSAIAG